ncbi:MAG: hypothetical protein IPH48_18755 [bacterium]|nr:hypothetical protein [bacterium]
MRNTSAIAIAAACLLALATPAFADVNLHPEPADRMELAAGAASGQ